MWEPIKVGALNVIIIGAVCVAPKIYSTTSTIYGVSIPFKIIDLEFCALLLDFIFLLFSLQSFIFSPLLFLDLFFEAINPCLSSQFQSPPSLPLKIGYKTLGP